MSDSISIWSQHRDMLPRFWTLVYVQIPLYTPWCVITNRYAQLRWGKIMTAAPMLILELLEVGRWRVDHDLSHIAIGSRQYIKYIFDRDDTSQLKAVQCVNCLLQDWSRSSRLRVGGGIRFDMLHFVTMQCDLIQW